MISHEDTNDLIESVTAEIEAIIQEEINSQNLYAPIEPVVEPVAEPENENIGGDVVPTVGVQPEIFTENLELTNPNKIIETSETVKIIETPTETVQTFEFAENASATVNSFEAIAEIRNEEYVEYTVKVASSTQDGNTTSLNEVNETILPVFATIESILNDAPIDEKDGPRAKHLKQALRKALNNTAKSCSGDKLESCFPFNLKTNQFAQINSTIIATLKSVIDGVQEPFDEFLKSENLIEKLNKVDEFTRSRVPGTSEASEAAILASLTPRNLIDRKLYSTKLAALAKLEQFTQTLELENSQLSSELNNRQTEFADRLDRLKSSQQLLDAALDQISTISMEDLEVLVDKMNHQYQPSALKFHN